jgi:hypothetical protein
MHAGAVMCSAMHSDTVSDFGRYGEKDFDRHSEKNILFEMSGYVIDAPHCSDLFVVDRDTARVCVLVR